RLAPHHRHPRLCRRSADPLSENLFLALGRKPRMRRLRPFILIILILAAWETAARSDLWSPILFPSLERIGQELWIFVSRPHGAKSGNPVLIWSAQNMGASRLRTLARVVFPAMLPYVFAALRVALPVALIVAIITEMISSVDGLGYLVSYSLSSLKTDRMLAIVVVISLLGLALDHALVALRDRLVYWEKLDTFYV